MKRIEFAFVLVTTVYSAFGSYLIGCLLWRAIKLLLLESGDLPVDFSSFDDGMPVVFGILFFLLLFLFGERVTHGS